MSPTRINAVRTALGFAVMCCCLGAVLGSPAQKGDLVFKDFAETFNPDQLRVTVTSATGVLRGNVTLPKLFKSEYRSAATAGKLVFAVTGPDRTSAAISNVALVVADFSKSVPKVVAKLRLPTGALGSNCGLVAFEDAFLAATRSGKDTYRVAVNLRCYTKAACVTKSFIALYNYNARLRKVGLSKSKYLLATGKDGKHPPEECDFKGIIPRRLKYISGRLYTLALTTPNFDKTKLIRLTSKGFKTTLSAVSPYKYEDLFNYPGGECRFIDIVSPYSFSAKCGKETKGKPSTVTVFLVKKGYTATPLVVGRPIPVDLFQFAKNIDKAERFNGAYASSSSSSPWFAAKYRTDTDTSTVYTTSKTSKVAWEVAFTLPSELAGFEPGLDFIQ